MSWLNKTFDKLKEASTAEPIDCPRGWGKVSFFFEPGTSWLLVHLPFAFDFTRRCPIGGVASCHECCYPFKPEDAERLRDNLDKLDALRKDRVLSESEYEVRRAMIIHLQDGTSQQPGDGFRAAAWLLGVPGLAVTVVSSWLAMSMEPQILWTMLAFVGGVAVAASVSCGVLAATRKKAEASASNPRDPGLQRGN